MTDATDTPLCRELVTNVTGELSDDEYWQLIAGQDWSALPGAEEEIVPCL